MCVRYVFDFYIVLRNTKILNTKVSAVPHLKPALGYAHYEPSICHIATESTLSRVRTRVCASVTRGGESFSAFTVGSRVVASAPRRRPRGSFPSVRIPTDSFRSRRLYDDGCVHSANAVTTRPTRLGIA